MCVELDVLMRLETFLLIGLVACHPMGDRPKPATRNPAPITLPGVPPLVITERAMGPLTLGMKVGDLARALPHTSLETSEDGDGLASLDLMAQKQPLVSAYVGDATPQSPLTDPARTVDSLEAFIPHPSTQDGVRVGMKLKDVEKIWGPVTQIVWTEIESREFVTFQRSPKWLVIRTYGGIYPGGDQTKPTQKYQPDATIHSLAISIHHP